MKALCTKTLIHGDGSESFTKGVEYEFAWGTTNYVINSNTNLIDNQKDTHVLGHSYVKHFKLVK
jgi:hypothetical protein